MKLYTASGEESGTAQDFVRVERKEFACGCSDFVVSSPLWCQRHINNTFTHNEQWIHSINSLMAWNILEIKL